MLIMGKIPEFVSEGVFWFYRINKINTGQVPVWKMWLSVCVCLWQVVCCLFLLYYVVVCIGHVVASIWLLCSCSCLHLTCWLLCSCSYLHQTCSSSCLHLSVGCRSSVDQKLNPSSFCVWVLKTGWMQDALQDHVTSIHGKNVIVTGPFLNF